MSLHWLPVILQVPKNSSVIRWKVRQATAGHRLRHGTVTGCGAAVIGTEKGEVCIRGITTGKVIDFGVKDSMNMGACMAPAAADVIAANLEDMQKDVTYYDCIITGDLGAVGKTILMDLLKEKGYDLTGRYTDCGLEIFDAESQDTKAGWKRLRLFCSYNVFIYYEKK